MICKPYFKSSPQSAVRRVAGRVRASARDHEKIRTREAIENSREREFELKLSQESLSAVRRVARSVRAARARAV